jgi:hypothetical protein
MPPIEFKLDPDRFYKAVQNGVADALTGVDVHEAITEGVRLAATVLFERLVGGLVARRDQEAADRQKRITASFQNAFEIAAGIAVGANAKVLAAYHFETVLEAEGLDEAAITAKMRELDDAINAPDDTGGKG